MKVYDVIIIGGGPAGYHAALRLDENRKRVLLIEKRKVGGVCLHEGCIPTKSLLNSVKNITENMEFQKIIKKKNKDIFNLYKGLQKQIEQSGIELVIGNAIIREKKNDFFIVMIDGVEYFGKNLVIATGSSAKKLEIIGLNKAMKYGQAVYSDEFLALEKIPQKVTIIGGGVIGIEFATYLAKLKKQVQIIEVQKEILSEVIDEDIRTIFLNELKGLGIEVITNAMIQEIDDYNIVYEKDGKLEELSTNLIIVTGGRVGNVKDIGLEHLGIEVQNEVILVDEYCSTNILNVYACGDVIGKSMLAHTAYKEAEIVADCICGIKSKMSYRAIPEVIFSDPEIAVTGISEFQCQNNKYEYHVKKCSMNYSSRYLIEYSRQQGMCKMIFDKKNILIGAQLIGNGSSELIFVLNDMIAQKQTKESIRNKIYPHPSIVEIIKETINISN